MIEPSRWAVIRVWRLLECVGGDWVMAGGCKTQMVSIKGLSLNDKLLIS